MDMFSNVYMVPPPDILTEEDYNSGRFCEKIEMDCWRCIVEVNNNKSSAQGIV